VRALPPGGLWRTELRRATLIPMTTTSSPSPAPDSNSAIRAQILATEHWGLLATRSLTWSEVMSRITIHLTVCSAWLVVIALVVQADGFGTAFDVLSAGLASAMLVLGTLTSVRVSNASVDDQYVIAAMNRLRAGYLELDPGVERYLAGSSRDDAVGVMMTSTLGAKRSRVSHVVASTSFFINVVNAIVAGTVGALVTHDAGGHAPLMGAVGCVTGLAYLAAMVEIGRRRFGNVLTSRSPTDD
jgi:hypothetical protein